MVPDGEQWWCLNGNLHRTDGPALVRYNGTKKWYLNGKLHRIDGPAVVLTDGTKEWYQNGKRHREDGPAVVWSDGTKKWYLDGERHREDGPAVIYSSGAAEWILYGECLVKIKPRYRRVHIGEYSLALNTSLVKQVMKERGIASLEGFCSWLAFDVLGDEAGVVFREIREKVNHEEERLCFIIEEYLRNHEDYAGLLFSWWYPIVGGDEVGK